MTTVADIMTPNSITVTPQTPLQEAIKLLAEEHISGLPVINNLGKLVGIISETDLMWQEAGFEASPYIMILDSVIYLQNPARHEKKIHKVLGQTVEEVMTSKPISIKSSQPLREAARIMHNKKISRLPVIDDQEDKVIGLLTQGDIIRSMAKD